MKKIFSKISSKLNILKKPLLVVFLSLFFTPSAFSSAIIHTKINEIVEINTSGEVGIKSSEWIITKDGQIIDKKNEGKFNHTFNEAGEYIVNLLINKNDNSIKKTTIKILVSKEDFIEPLEPQAVLNTMPPIDEEYGGVILNNTLKKVSFLAKNSLGQDLKEFRIDADVEIDSNGDGIADNDIDNKSHSSFYDGSLWEKEFSEDKIVKLTVVDKEGRMNSKKIKIIFSEDYFKQNADILAKLSSFPVADNEGLIHLKKEAKEVTFFAGNSQGDIIEYRIDKNINFDTDQDGNPANDIDNINDASFKTGQMWTTDFDVSWGDIVVQLTVVDSSGTGSQVQRKIVFDFENNQQPPIKLNLTKSLQELSVLQPKLFVKSNEINTGQSLNFTILNAPSDALFSWDFDSDGQFEIKDKSQSSVGFLFEKEGEFEVKVKLKSQQKTNLKDNQLTTKIIVKPKDQQIITDFAPPLADFDFSIDKKTVNFTNLSSVDQNLENQELTFLWDFGDGNIKNDSDPVHTFAEKGNFNVTLTVTDSAEQKAKKTKNIDINYQQAQEGENNSATDIVNKNQNNQESNNKNENKEEDQNKEESSSKITYLVILLIAAIILGILSFFVIEKIRHPSLTFGEILEGIINKFDQNPEDFLADEQNKNDLSTIQGQTQDKTQEIVAEETEVVTDTQDSNENNNSNENKDSINQDAAIIDKNENNNEAKKEPAPLEKSDAAPPSWLKNANNKTQNNSSDNQSKSNDDPFKKSNPPNWLNDEF